MINLFLTFVDLLNKNYSLSDISNLHIGVKNQQKKKREKFQTAMIRGTLLAARRLSISRPILFGSEIGLFRFEKKMTKIIKKIKKNIKKNVKLNIKEKQQKKIRR